MGQEPSHLFIFASTDFETNNVQLFCLRNGILRLTETTGLEPNSFLLKDAENEAQKGQTTCKFPAKPGGEPRFVRLQGLACFQLPLTATYA